MDGLSNIPDIQGQERDQIHFQFHSIVGVADVEEDLDMGDARLQGSRFVVRGEEV
jgi:hypothetical protein